MIFIIAIETFSVSWYCKKTKDHTQPALGCDLKCAEQYGAFWRDKKHTNMSDDDKVIYLTFDAGYENGNIEKILDVLKAEEICGNFFILSNLVNKNLELVNRMVDEGHTVANHTARHKNMSKIKNKQDFEKELKDLETLFKEKTGAEIKKYYRPPEGEFSEENLKWAEEMGYKTVFWSFAYADWDNSKQICKETALKKILDNIHNGEVLLLHPTSETNAAIMPDLIKALKEKGFRFGDLDELCNS